MNETPNNGEFAYINRAYGLNIVRGSRVEYTGDVKDGQRVPRQGSVTSGAGQYINVRFDDDPKKRSAGPYHPTWEMRYLDTEAVSP